MRTIKLFALVTILTLLAACTNMENPISSENNEEENTYNDEILFDTSGTGEVG